MVKELSRLEWAGVITALVGFASLLTLPIADALIALSSLLLIPFEGSRKDEDVKKTRLGVASLGLSAGGLASILLSFLLNSPEVLKIGVGFSYLSLLPLTALLMLLTGSRRRWVLALSVALIAVSSASISLLSNELLSKYLLTLSEGLSLEYLLSEWSFMQVLVFSPISTVVMITAVLIILEVVVGIKEGSSEKR